MKYDNRKTTKSPSMLHVKNTAIFVYCKIESIVGYSYNINITDLKHPHSNQMNIFRIPGVHAHFILYFPFELNFNVSYGRQNDEKMCQSNCKVFGYWFLTTAVLWRFSHDAKHTRCSVWLFFVTSNPSPKGNNIISNVLKDIHRHKKYHSKYYFRLKELQRSSSLTAVENTE